MKQCKQCPTCWWREGPDGCLVAGTGPAPFEISGTDTCDFYWPPIPGLPGREALRRYSCAYGGVR